MAGILQRIWGAPAGNEAAKPDTTSSAYDAMACLWGLPRALMGGTRTMREAGTEYLPQEKGETQTAYEIRLARTFLFNAFKRTVYNVAGKIFSKPIVLGDDVNQRVKDWFENIDLTGRNIDTFASALVIDAMQTGITHVLVDMQRGPRAINAGGNPRARTVAEEKAAGLRPYAVHVTAENLIGWRSEKINGVQTLTQIRIMECSTEPDGEFGETQVERIRVIWRDRFALYERDAQSSDYIEVDEGPMTTGKIELYTFYTGRTEFMRAEPTLQDLADLNVAHWQSSSDQRHILHFARVPILFQAGFGKNEGGVEEIGPNRMFKANNPQAKMEVVEHTGQAIGAGRTDLLDLEDRMRVMGLELFLARPGNVTATGRAIDANEVNSFVKSVALALKDCLEGVAESMGRWGGLGADKGGTLNVNTDFGISLRDAQDIAQLIQARLAGEISRETFWLELKRRGFLSDGFDAAAEQLALDEEMPDGDDDLFDLPPEPGADADDQRTAA